MCIVEQICDLTPHIEWLIGGSSVYSQTPPDGTV
jgi:hypothetical protein